MTTTSFSFNLSHADDAGFNAWGSRVSTALSDCGLIQTADTGQITFSGSPLITKPVANTDAGYQIWRFNDLLHTGSPSFPLYLKFRFGTGVTVGSDAALDCAVGTSTDGAGTLTGSTSDVFEFENTATVTGQKAGPCFFVHSEGFFGMVFGHAGQSTSQIELAWFVGFVSRSCDAVGVSSEDAFFITSQHKQTSVNTSSEFKVAHQSVNYVTGIKRGTTNIGAGIQPAYSILPGGDDTISYADTDGNIAVFPSFGAAPQPFPMNSMVFGWTADIPVFMTFTATPIGTTQRTYLALHGRILGSSGPAIVSESETDEYVMCISWE